MRKRVQFGQIMLNYLQSVDGGTILLKTCSELSNVQRYGQKFTDFVRKGIFVMPNSAADAQVIRSR